MKLSNKYCSYLGGKLTNKIHFFSVDNVDLHIPKTLRIVTGILYVSVSFIACIILSLSFIVVSIKYIRKTEIVEVHGKSKYHKRLKQTLWRNNHR